MSILSGKTTFLLYFTFFAWGGGGSNFTSQEQIKGHPNYGRVIFSKKDNRASPNLFLFAKLAENIEVFTHTR